jgi:hypothetical protein
LVFNCKSDYEQTDVDVKAIYQLAEQLKQKLIGNEAKQGAKAQEGVPGPNQ